MLLGCNTQAPTAELYLFSADGQLVARQDWLAERELAHHLLRKLTELLAENNLTLGEVDGLFAFQGPGSFTGLRIGLTVMNTLAYSLDIPVVGASGDNWTADAVQRLANGDDDKIVLPAYGAPARITQPKK